MIARYFIVGRIGLSRHLDHIGKVAIADRQRRDNEDRYALLCDSFAEARLELARLNGEKRVIRGFTTKKRERVA